MQTITEKVTETVKPVINTAIQKTTPALTSVIEGAISVVERIDPEAKQREPVFSGHKGEERKSAPQANAASREDSKQVEEAEAVE